MSREQALSIDLNDPYRVGQFNETGQQICGARTKGGKGPPCQSTALFDSGRCKMHGGMSPKGAATTAFRDGRGSKYMPRRIEEKFNIARQDPELLSLRDDIALVDARVWDLLTRVDSGEAGKTWEKLSQLRTSALKALARNDNPRLIQILNELFAVIEQGSLDFTAWSEIFGALDQRRKLVETEQKRLVSMEQMLTAEQAMAFVKGLSYAIRQLVSKYLEAEKADEFLEEVSLVMAEYIDA